MKSETLFGGFLGAFTAVLIIFAFAVPVKGLRDRQLDQQTVTALSEVQSALYQYVAENDDLPKSVKDLEFDEYDRSKKSKGALDRITIEGTKTDYKLCATFYTDTQSKDKSGPADSAMSVGNLVKSSFTGSYGSSGFSKHPKGNHCFDGQADPYGNNDYFDSYKSQDYDISYGSSGLEGNDINEKAKDSERRSDINSIYSQAEIYFAEKGYYPTIANLDDSAFVDREMPGLTADALKDPDGSTTSLSNKPMPNSYSYEVTPSGCNNTSLPCTGFILTAMLSDGSKFSKNGVNN